MTTPTQPEVSAERREQVSALWQDLLEKGDRTSLLEYPDMALITFDGFAACFAALDAQAKGEADARYNKLTAVNEQLQLRCIELCEQTGKAEFLAETVKAEADAMVEAMRERFIAKVREFDVEKRFKVPDSWRDGMTASEIYGTGICDAAAFILEELTAMPIEGDG